MARIIDFAVSGLVGRDDTYHQRLNRHVNVIFGLNGSGKTSLLKILHSALTGDADILRGVVFEKAQVTIVSAGTQGISTRTIARATPAEKAKRFPSYSEEFARHGVTESEYRLMRARELDETRLAWATVPDGAATTRWAHRYLPTTRLYLDPDSVSRTQGRLVSASDRRTEEQIESRFTSLIESLWTRYTSTMLKAVGEAQADGLANIFKAILIDSPTTAGASVIEAKQAYRRLSSFLRRQGSPRLLGSFEHFVDRYETNPQMRRVVEDINAVEERIERATAQRDTLQRLIESMFTGKKQVTFADTGIKIASALETPITLASLSSGEKHLLRILVEVLLAEENAIIIDEPELSMHVDWQHKLVHAMRQVNPEAQLILATHSPEVMAEVPDSEVFRV